eukprot:1153391-Pelagomonas_calceolata.AAC.16
MILNIAPPRHASISSCKRPHMAEVPHLDEGGEAGSSRSAKRKDTQLPFPLNDILMPISKLLSTRRRYPILLVLSSSSVGKIVY